VAGNPDPSTRGESEARNALQAMAPRLGEAPHALLGVAPDATPEQLRAAFLKLTKQFHPTKYARFAPDVVRLANEVFLTIKRAYDQLTGPVRASGTGSIPAATPRPATTPGVAPRPGPTPPRPSSATGSPPTRAATPTPGQRAQTPAPRATTPGTTPRAPSPPPRATTTPGTGPARGVPPTGAPRPAPASAADDAWEQAQDLLRRKLWGDARQAFHKLAVASPQEKRFRAYMHYARGREAHDAGRADEARAELQRALALEPDLAVAKRALDDLPPEPPSGGLLSRFFKR
jgi:tetratricopeptide (TPR) repeat protein